VIQALAAQKPTYENERLLELKEGYIEDFISRIVVRGTPEG